MLTVLISEKLPGHGRGRRNIHEGLMERTSLCSGRSSSGHPHCENNLQSIATPPRTEQMKVSLVDNYLFTQHKVYHISLTSSRPLRARAAVTAATSADGPCAFWTYCLKMPVKR
jgi:hypothetical protein